MTRSHRRARLGSQFSVLVFCVATASVAAASDWANWLGPNQDGSLRDAGLFSSDGAAPELSVTWSRDLGKAYSGISVVGQRAVTMFADGKTDWLTALSTLDGKELWRYRIDEMFPKIGGADGGQLGMPIVDEGVVYGLAAKGQLFAVSLETGKKIWSLRVDEKLGAKAPHFGFATTPIVIGDMLFVQTGGADGHSLTALDKKTGKVRWATGDEAVGYQSPVYTKLGGTAQIIAVTNKSVLGLAAADGKVLWSTTHDLVTRRDGWSTPILLGGDRFLLTGGAESVAFELVKGDDGPALEELWRAPTLKGNFAMPVVHEGHLYGYNGDFLACVDATTGKNKWKSRSDAAGLILIDDHLVLYASDGKVVVAEASPKGFEERASVKVAEKAGLTYPTFADGGFFVRNLTGIARVDIAKK